MKHSWQAAEHFLCADDVRACFSCRDAAELATVLSRILHDGGAAWSLIASGSGDAYRVLAATGIQVPPIVHITYQNTTPTIAERPDLIVLHRIGQWENQELIAATPSGDDRSSLAIALAQVALESLVERHQAALLEQTLLERNQLLETMFELTRDVTIATSRERLLHIAGLRLLTHAMTTRLLIAAVDRRNTCTVWSRGIRLEQQVIIDLARAVNASCPSHSLPDQLRLAVENQGVEMVLPLRVREQTVGVVLVGPRRDGRRIHAGDAFLRAYANALAAALEQLQLVEALVEQERLEQELMVARSIQRRLLPTHEQLSAINAADIAAFLEPARHVSGDYFDVVERGGNIIIIVADVCGKGVAAALLMAHLHAAFHMLVRTGSSPAQILTELNRLLCKHTDSGAFVTAIVAAYDPTSGQVRYCNAGHPRPLLTVDGNRSSVLDGGSLVLGVLEDVRYQEHVVELRAGEMVCFYTDGIIEAPSVDGEEFGVERLQRVLSQTAEQPLESVLAAVRSAVAEHTGVQTLTDDQTLVLLRSKRP